MALVFEVVPICEQKSRLVDTLVNSQPRHYTYMNARQG